MGEWTLFYLIMKVDSMRVFPTLHSIGSCWELGIGHSGGQSVKHYKSGLFPLEELVVIHLAVHAECALWA